MSGVEQLTPQAHLCNKDSIAENDSYVLNGSNLSGVCADLTSIFTFEHEGCGNSNSSSSSSFVSNNTLPSSSSSNTIITSTLISKPLSSSSSLFIPSVTKSTPIAASSGVSAVNDFKTPKDTSIGHLLKGDLCAVCLSPLVKGKREDFSPECIEDGNRISYSSSKDIPGSEDKKALCETRCKHCFHQKCLERAKLIKAECPLCRFELTPPERTSKFLAPPAMRSAISDAASRARNAVRAAMLRRTMAANNTTDQSDSTAPDSSRVAFISTTSDSGPHPGSI